MGGQQAGQVALARDPALQLVGGGEQPGVPAAEGLRAHRRPERAVGERLAAAAPLVPGRHPAEQVDELADVNEAGHLAQGAFQQGTAGAAGAGQVDDGGLTSHAGLTVPVRE
jgi:hypothetical protein